MDPTRVARLLATGRIAAGLAFVVAPRTASRVWVGRTDPTAARVVGRAFGVRDLVLGIGLMRAVGLRRDTDTWLILGAVSDGVDATATLTSLGRLPRWTRWLVLGSSTGATAAGMSIVGKIPDQA